jgi:hypothetical protein
MIGDRENAMNRDPLAANAAAPDQTASDIIAECDGPSPRRCVKIFAAHSFCDMHNAHLASRRPLS